MKSKKKRQQKLDEVYTQLAIRVEHYEAHVNAGVNHHAFEPQYAWNSDDNDPLYEFGTTILLKGVSTYPEERAGDVYEMTIYGDDAPSRRLNATLKDVQKRDQYRSPQYRTYRGRQIPIYEPPSGVGFLDKVRGERRWTSFLFAPTRFANTMLRLLGHNRVLFVSLREFKKDRTRWVRDFSLQTVDPIEE